MKQKKENGGAHILLILIVACLLVGGCIGLLNKRGIITIRLGKIKKEKAFNVEPTATHIKEILGNPIAEKEGETYTYLFYPSLEDKEKKKYIIVFGNEETESILKEK